MMKLEDFECFAVANSILDELDWLGYEVTHLKLQKLLYFAYGVYLIIREQGDDECLFPSKIEAWKQGPIVRCIFNELKIKLGNRILPDERIYILSGKYDDVVFTPRLLETDIKKLKSVIITCKVFGKYSDRYLENRLTQEGTPWYTVYEKMKNNEIKKELIKTEFEQRNSSVNKILLTSLRRIT